MAYKGMEYLKRKLKARKPRVLKRYRYYEMKDNHRPNNIMVPTRLVRKFSQNLGWCAKSVDALADRLQFIGFENDEFNLNEIFKMNNFDILCNSAILGALISSCDFIYIYLSEDGLPRMQVIPGFNATGIMDPTTGMLKEGYAVLEADENDNPIIEAYFLPGETWFYEKDKEPYVIENTAPYPLLVPVVNRPDAKREFGHSRISRSCMSLQNRAKEALLNLSIASEVAAFPQKYVLGLDEDAEAIDKDAAAVTKWLQINRGQDGTMPTVGQFQQVSLAPYLDEVKTIVSLFAGETGLTSDDLGFTSDNPSSSDAIKAGHETLRTEARKAQKHFGVGLLNAGYLCACIRDKQFYTRSEFEEVTLQWEPIFEPDASSIGAIGDAAFKINQAVPGYFTKENIRLMTGIKGSDTNNGEF